MPLPYVSNRNELSRSVSSYVEELANLDDFSAEVGREVVRLMPRQNLWVAVVGEDGRFYVAPSKYAAHWGVDLKSYLKHLYEPEGSSERIDGTEADRRISDLGGSEIAVRDSTHPAAEAVRELCRKFGKAPKRGASVRVFEDSGLETAEEQREKDVLSPELQAVLRMGLTIPQAKQALAARFGCRTSNVEIIIRA